MQFSSTTIKAPLGGSFRARWRASNEMAQAKSRLAGGSLALGVLSALHLWGGLGPFDQPLPWVLAYVLGSLAWGGVIKLRLASLRVRLLVATVQVQVQVAQALRHAVRADDMVARLGGDEFAILARGLGHDEGAQAVADKVMLGIKREGKGAMRIRARLDERRASN